MLEARALTKQFGASFAVNEVSFRVEAGEIMALLGANGAGKSTTTKLFLGLLNPDSGQALIGDLEVEKSPREARAMVAYIPDQLALYPQLTARENLDYFQRIRGASVRAEELETWLMEAGLERRQIDAPLATFSKGMRQKVGLALALAKSARALLLDEPLSGLDPSAANDFCKTLSGVRDRGAAVLMATHDLFRARETADVVAIMSRGRLLHTLRTRDVTHSELESIYLEAVR